MSRSSLAQQTAEWIQRQIRDGVWPLNSRIPTEMELAALLGVGRSTVREATQSMVRTGMLESAAGRGTFVRSRNAVNGVLSEYLLDQPVRDLLELRRALEVEAAGLAALRRGEADLEHLRRSLDLAAQSQATVADGVACSDDPPNADPSPSPGSFHADLFVAADNALLTEVYQAAMVAMRRAVSQGALSPGPAGERHADHVTLLETIIDGDVTAARAAAATHCDRDFLVTPRAGDATRTRA